MARLRRKAELPRKDCPVCGRPFVWRHRWARDWEQVTYCSERCRRSSSKREGSRMTRPGPTALLLAVLMAFPALAADNAKPAGTAALLDLLPAASVTRHSL